MNQPIIDRYRSFWVTYSAEADFVSMAKCIKGILTFCDLKSMPELVEEAERMCAELERYQPLMDLDEFTTCTKVIIYARRRIELTRGTRYAARLSAALTDAELAELRSAGAKGAGRGPEEFDTASQGDPGAGDDFRALPDDGNGAG